MPEISLVLLQHNFGHFTKRAYESVMAGTVVPDEVIIVDNGSDPEARQWYRDLKRKRRITAVELPENRNFVLGMNAGWERATGDYVILQANDTVVTQTCLERLVQTAKLDKRIGYLSACYLAGPWANALASVPSEHLIGVPDDMRELNAFAKTLPPRFSEVEVTEATLVLIPRYASDAVGKWWEELISWHTHDYSWRLREAGYITAVCPSAIFWHHTGHPTLVSMAWDFQKADRQSETTLRKRWANGCPPLRTGTGDVKPAVRLAGPLPAAEPKPEDAPLNVLRSSEGGAFERPKPPER